MTSHPLVYSQPKFSLTEDLLWRILSINVEMESEKDDSALTALRRASQVSSSWRELVLSAASLWGKVINLNHLNQKTDDWRAEVLRRSGKSLLYVKGTTGRDQQSAEFFISILTCHWDRIRSLDLDEQGEIHYITYSVICSVFQQPAPFLETFNVPTFHKRDIPLVVASGFRFFSDDAPSLRYFKSFAEEIPFHITAPWVPQLLSLFLMHPVTGRQLLEAFANMRFLEKFAGNSDLIADPDDSSLPMVTLPCLRQMIIKTVTESNIWILVLSKITPAAECSLNLGLNVGRNLLTPTDMSATCQLLSSYSRRSFNTHKILSVRLYIAANVFYIIDVNENISPTEVLTFGLMSDSPFPTSASSTILGSLSQCHWNRKITRLDLTILGDGLGSSDSNLVEFLSSFTSLESLTLGSETLQLLGGIPRDAARALLPSLRQVRYWTRVQGEGEESDSDILEPFLMSRSTIGHPLEVLELIWPNGITIYRDFQFLDVFVGLKVHFCIGDRRIRYQCGSGEPEILDLPRRGYYYSDV